MIIRSGATPLVLLCAICVLGLLYAGLTQAPIVSASSYLPASLLSNLPSFPRKAVPIQQGVQFAYDPAFKLAFRNHLERTTSPPAQVIHSPTLTFSSIYVLSLPNRLDRREQMGKLARALGITVEFVDAVSKNEPFVQWIAERVRQVRDQKAALIAKARGMPVAEVGGLIINNMWLQPSQDNVTYIPYPPLNLPNYPHTSSWVDHLESTPLDQLKPDNPDVNVAELLFDPNEKIQGRQVNAGTISTFWGHTRAMKKILEKKEESALIIEDDVDVEWDLERMWAIAERRLPRDWEMVFLGNCWGKEHSRPQYLHPHLHLSSQPLCLHGYALSQAGAATLLKHLNNPWTAYLTAVDTAVPSYIVQRLIPLTFSLEPPLIIQRKEVASDIQEGVGSVWKGLLADSTVDRIRMDEGEPVPVEVYDEENLDPATIFRYGSGPRCAIQAIKYQNSPPTENLDFTLKDRKPKPNRLSNLGHEKVQDLPGRRPHP